ncbi:MAG TPA: flagellar assembly protein FliH [Beijerinckiaceae bacterium]|jgi:flagellar assembly protein FliH
MTQASRFLFDHDFRDPRGGGGRAVAEAEERGRAAGLAQGLAQAQGSAPARLAQAAERLAAQAGALLADADARQARLEEEAIAFALAFARKLAGEALDANPLGPVAEAARAAFRHMRAVPHLAVRVNGALVDDVDGLLARLARERGFEGRIVVLGEPDIPLGDARLEWADGGIVRDRSRLEAAVADAAARPPAL